ncbi:MAG TPA: ATP-dependent helicase, partial [Planctomycetaceae bacterium]|nr:ATP-dependent helicase [Planctomycetaceae bacterium]
MADPALLSAIFEGLNPRQLEAVQHGDSPLLIIAGAGSGKTKTLVHRVACAMARGVEPGRILLLTFSRRAAAEMLRRVDGLIRQVAQSAREQARLDGRQAWGGTFHAIAARLLRLHGRSIGLDPGFTILDRSDSEDLLDVARTDLGLSRTDKRFPRKGTCLSIYSQCVNTGRDLAEILVDDYPWCEEYGDALKGLFREYVDRKEAAAILDYDDLLLFWRELLADPTVGDQIRSRFDMVLVDEYQDTNHLQAETLKLLRPAGTGLTVVGDDAQSIYAFRGATIRNILDFPQEFPGTTVVKLEQNYRSTQPILEATNRVIAEAAEGYQKALWTTRNGGQLPALVPCEDENEQSEYVATRILEHREGGLNLRKQAVLFRASHHSILLEAELTRRKIPFVKYGGLKFTEAAHVKDLMAFLRLAENPRDVISGSRILTLLPGIGPKRARQLLDQLASSGGAFHVWAEASVPAATAEQWPA